MITPLPFGEGKGEGPAGGGGGAIIFLPFVCSVLLCSSVRKRTHPLYEMTHKQHAEEVFLSRWGGLSLTELTELTEPFCAQFRAHERVAPPPSPPPQGRGVVCEVTPISLLIIGEGLLNIRRTWRGISVITPFSIRRGAGGEASLGCNAL